jgi:hypothetical protein
VVVVAVVMFWFMCCTLGRYGLPGFSRSTHRCTRIHRALWR